MSMKMMGTRLKILLIGSLVLNVVFLGLVGGHIYQRWSHHPWHQVKQDLSPEARNVVGRNFQSAFREIKPLGNEARKARADLVKVLSAKDFDGEAFDKAAARLLELRGEMKALKIQTTKEVAAQLSYEDRKTMANRMAKMVGGGHERKVKRHRKPRMITPEKKPEH